MMTQRLVSIVLPVYNGQRYVRGAIESIQSQTYKNWELIVVDDASTDRTPAIIRELAKRDDRIRVIQHAENRKLPAALNTGFADSRGEYLTWTSHDNVFEPEAIALMVETLGEHPEIGMVYCDFRSVGPAGEDQGVQRLPGPEAFPENGWVGACFLYRRQVYQTIGDYDPGMCLVEDFEYFVRVHQRFQMLHRSDVAPYKYRYHPHSLTSRKQTRIELQKARAIYRHTLSGAQRRRETAAAYCRTAWKARCQGDYWGACQYYLESFATAGVTLPALVGLVKLLPHRVARVLRIAPSAGAVDARASSSSRRVPGD